jgi:TrmH family RNA methyltransferase
MTDQERYRAARRDPGLVVIEGFHAIKHAARFGACFEDMLTTAPDALHALVESLAPDRASDFRTARLYPLPIENLTPTPPRTQVIAIARRPAYDAIAAPAGPVVLLDRPRHPGNIGAAVRVAAAAGAAALWTTGDVDPWGPAAVRGAAGLQFALPVIRLDPGSIGLSAIPGAALDPATGRTLIAVHPDGREPTPGPASRTTQQAVFLFGSERDGIDPVLLARANDRLRIPMRTGVSSLNLATAVAIVLYRYAPAQADVI